MIPTPVVFKSFSSFEDGVFGDYKTMILDSKYEKSLFLFNDNFEQRNNVNRGAGNACVRPYKNNTFFPKSAGIPTGWSVSSGGFTRLDDIVKQVVDLSFERIALLHAEHSYDYIFYSAESNGKIGMGVFTIHSTVADYITMRLKKVLSPSTRTYKEISDEESGIIVPELSVLQRHFKISNINKSHRLQVPKSQKISTASKSFVQSTLKTSSFFKPAPLFKPALFSKPSSLKSFLVNSSSSRIASSINSLFVSSSFNEQHSEHTNYSTKNKEKSYVSPVVTMNESMLAFAPSHIRLMRQRIMSKTPHEYVVQ